MSRIGKLPIAIPEKVEANVSSNIVTIKGPKGELKLEVREEAKVNVADGEIIVEPQSEEKFARAYWGTTRANINNMVVWVTEGYSKSLEIIWVGYKFELSGNKLVLSIGYSHKVDVEIPKGIEVKADEKKKSIIHVSGIDKQAVWEFAANIRAYKKPEPYKGKGIRYVWEYVRRKAGKTGAAK